MGTFFGLLDRFGNTEYVTIRFTKSSHDPKPLGHADTIRGRVLVTGSQHLVFAGEVHPKLEP
jgi:hypothetical protein